MRKVAILILSGLFLSAPMAAACSGRPVARPSSTSTNTATNQTTGHTTSQTGTAAASTPTAKDRWYAAVSRAMAPAFDYLDQRTPAPGQRLAINLDIDNVSLATHYDHLAPVPDTLALAKRARSLGMAVLFNTGRNPTKLAAVLPRLEAAGFGASEYCGRRDGEKVLHSKMRCRAHFKAEGYTLILNVGNNPTDFRGGNYDRAIKLPNEGGRLS